MPSTEEFENIQTEAEDTPHDGRVLRSHKDLQRMIKLKKNIKHAFGVKMVSHQESDGSNRITFYSRLCTIVNENGILEFWKIDDKNFQKLDNLYAKKTNFGIHMIQSTKGFQVINILQISTNEIDFQYIGAKTSQLGAGQKLGLLIF